MIRDIFTREFWTDEYAVKGWHLAAFALGPFVWGLVVGIMG